MESVQDNKAKKEATAAEEVNTMQSGEKPVTSEEKSGGQAKITDHPKSVESEQEQKKEEK